MTQVKRQCEGRGTLQNAKWKCIISNDPGTVACQDPQKRARLSLQLAVQVHEMNPSTSRKEQLQKSCIFKSNRPGAS
eukprot:79849-Pelagomonas_calceolata.AAC.3